MSYTSQQLPLCLGKPDTPGQHNVGKREERAKNNAETIHLCSNQQIHSAVPHFVCFMVHMVCKTTLAPRGSSRVVLLYTHISVRGHQGRGGHDTLRTAPHLSVSAHHHRWPPNSQHNSQLTLGVATYAHQGYPRQSSSPSSPPSGPSGSSSEARFSLLLSWIFLISSAYLLKVLPNLDHTLHGTVMEFRYVGFTSLTLMKTPYLLEPTSKKKRLLSTVREVPSGSSAGSSSTP
ncbi:hypothetical protein F7725_009761 [Dissostichus mawsoni]|uniref:Uncharacterized protein n=1 Tax=Dissostichus mawsoni TaxID=36200 RepID=A0A7J5XMB8_DISMA|nr:hypothetical protein F7725_009761 [Dissostichus mawsoni]